jgi:acyl-CoA synthetase (NDP forming)
VLKVSSPEIVHKTDVGGIKTGIASKAMLESELSAMKKRIKKAFPRAKFGFLLQQQVQGKEVIIGMKRDSQFGPVALFGMGGVNAEIFKDVSLRVCPLTKKDIDSMMCEVKSYALLTGYRGGKKVDIKGLAKILMNLSRLSLAEKQVSEIDFNPVIVNEKGAVVVDARML